jgi:hypothetical protein
MDSDGMTYGLTAKAWMASAKNSAAATITTSSAKDRMRALLTLRT